MSTAATARKKDKKWQILRMRELLQAEGINKLKTLAKALEDSYRVIDEFWTRNNDSYKKPLKPLTNVDKTVISLAESMPNFMDALRQGKLPTERTITSIQKEVNYMCEIGDHRTSNVAFKHYMVAMREITGILYDYLHPEPR